MTDFIIKKSTLREQGLFSNKDFAANTVLMKFTGKNLTNEELIKLSYDRQSATLQIGKTLYLDTNNEPDDFIAHRCQPNCYVKIAVNNAFLISLYPIKEGEELTFDYSLTSTDSLDEWKM